MKKIIRLTESDIHRIVKESVNRILNEKVLLPSLDGNGDVIQCFTNKANINKRFNGGMFGNGIYLKVGTPSEDDYRTYGSSLITVDVANNNLYFADDTKDAIEAAKSGNYPGIVYSSRHDGEVCVVFDDSIILGISK